MSTLNIIDVSTFEKQKENTQKKEKVLKKLEDMDIKHEVDKKYKNTHVTNPFLNVKTPKNNEELEKSKLLKSKITAETLFEKYKREKAKSDLVVLESETNIVKETAEYDQAIQTFSDSDIGRVTNENINNLISSYYSNNVIKKQIFKNRLESNPVIQRNNQLLAFNVLTSLPLAVQMPLFIGLELLQTEDCYNQLVFNAQKHQSQKTQQPEKFEEVKE